MPTTLPTSTPPVRAMSWPEIVRFFLLLALSHWLHHRLMAADRRAKRLGVPGDGAGLLRAARRWLACHEAIAALLRQPVPPQVARMQQTLRRRAAVDFTATPGRHAQSGPPPSSES